MFRQLSLGRHQMAIAAACLALLVTSCGEGPSDAGNGAAMLPPDAGIAELAAMFSACPEKPDDVASAPEYVAAAVAWMRVDTVVRASDDFDRTLPATVLPQEPDGGVSTTEEEVSIHGSYWPGIQWALGNGGQVWFAIGDPEIYTGKNYVMYVLTYTPDGQAFFPGRCQHDILYQPLQRALAEDFEATMAALPGKTGEELAIALRGQAP